ncbi:Retrotransposable element Tf2 155 kDa protein type 2 [Harpegnathos saltator]|uniref:RNA-directed DNA polymerase n=1 Tax=Harpegnathos saltator TaxID=610380 RepID=E2C8Z4_HARSA|nr:Retrotransposable element Tf2 155 kDa protein type 2 [Harpegnathos saltator]
MTGKKEKGVMEGELKEMMWEMIEEWRSAKKDLEEMKLEMERREERQEEEEEEERKRREREEEVSLEEGISKLKEGGAGEVGYKGMEGVEEKLSRVEKGLEREEREKRRKNSEIWVDKKEWERARERLPKGYTWKTQWAGRKNRKGREMGGMLVGVKIGMKVEREGRRLEGEGIMVVKIRLEEEWWRIIGVYVNKDLENEREKLREWMEQKEEGGAILLQRDNNDQLFHPEYYASGKTTVAEERYSSYELEVLAIIKALRKFRIYVLSIPFKIITDCRAFALTMGKKDFCIRVARWALLLEEFIYTIEHRSGKSMTHVDALSRNPLPCVFAIDEDDGMIAKLKKAQREDSGIKQIIDSVEHQSVDGYVIRDGLLFKEIDHDVRLIVPKSMQIQIIRRAHKLGHFSINKTEMLVKRDYRFSDMRAKVERVIRFASIVFLPRGNRASKRDGYTQ